MVVTVEQLSGLDLKVLLTIVALLTMRLPNVVEQSTYRVLPKQTVQIQLSKTPTLNIILQVPMVELSTGTLEHTTVL